MANKANSGSDHNNHVSFSGSVARIVFRNEENGYTVLELHRDDDEYTLVGTMPIVSVGDEIEGDGVWRFHDLYGPQIEARTVFRKEPEAPDKIERYLAAGAVRGIGPATAKKLVKAFGEKTLEVMRDHPERVAKIRGVGNKKADEFSRQLNEERAYQTLLLKLLPLGISVPRVMRIYETYGSHAETVIRENPFALAEDISGIGFQTADRIATAVGIRGDHPARLRSAVTFALQQELYRDGNTMVSAGKVSAELSEKLGVSAERIDDAIADLLQAGKLVRPFDAIATGFALPDAATACAEDRRDDAATEISRLRGAGGGVSPENGTAGDEEADFPRSSALFKNGDWISLYDTALIEQRFADRVAFLSSHALADDLRIDEAEARRAICATAEEEGFSPGEEQVRALMTALTSPFSVLTGGPGTGKTTIVRLLSRLLRERGEDVMLAAPTGRAARRLSEVCHLDAKTIHRLLSLQVVEDRYVGAGFWLDAEVLDADTLIVDECSMIDLFLFTRLLYSVRPGSRVLLIGDADQLPSIGPGQVLRDLLHAPNVPHARLEHIYRQEAHRLIVTNAHRVLKGEPPVIDQTLESDFIFIPCEDEEAMRQGVLKLCSDVLPRYYKVDGVYGAQVLTAIRRGRAGVAELNAALQKFAQKDLVGGLSVHGDVFMTGDKVIQTKNRYELEWTLLGAGETGKGVMNGEMGIVQSVSLSRRSVTVLFEEERLAVIEGEELDSLDLAYATTIHKSQGSEYPVEILVIPAGAPSFLTRNLLYTGITRAKRHLFLLTRKTTLSMMLQNNDANERLGALPYWLRCFARRR